MNIQPFTQQTWKQLHIFGTPDASALARGFNYYQSGKAQLIGVDLPYINFEVQGSQSEPYFVIGQLMKRRIHLACDCPFAADVDEIICKHKVAAAHIIAVDYADEIDEYNLLELINTPAQPLPKARPKWESIVSGALQTPEPKTTKAASQLLLFSLQSGYSAWKVVPYLMNASHFKDIDITDVKTVAKVIKRDKISFEAKEIRGKLDANRVVNRSENALMVARVASFTQHITYYDYSNRSLGYETLFPHLVDCLLFTGTQSAPFQTPVHISTTVGIPQVELTQSEEGLRLQAVIGLDDQIIPVTAKSPLTITTEPTWMLWKETLFPVEQTGGAYSVIAANPDLTIPPDEASQFLDNYLPEIAQKVPLRSDVVSWEDIETDPVPRLYLSERNGELHVQLRMGYSDREVVYAKNPPAQAVQRKPDSPVLVRIHRNLETELQAWTALSGFGLRRGEQPDEFALRARLDAVDFLLKHVPKLTEAGYEIYGEQDLASVRVNRNRPTMRFTVSSGIDWFDIKAFASFGDIPVPLAEIRQALRKKERFIKLADGSIGALPQDWLERYQHLFAFGEATADGVRLSEHHLPLLDQLLQETEENQFTVDEEFAKRRERLRAFEEIIPTPLPAGLKGELRPYQKAGYDWLHFLHQYEFGGLLADDMGIGKTIQTLSFLLSLRETKHTKSATLIVLPRSLLFNWKRESEKFTPSLRVLLHSDNDRIKDPKNFANYDLVLTTYGVMLRDIEILRKYKFHYVVLDESQAIKNPASQSAKAVRVLNSEHKLALTGTPVENSTIELWSQFAFLNPGLLGSQEYFRQQFANAIEKKQDEESAQLLRKLVFPFILRRTKDQVATDLPQRTERILYAEMEPGQRAFYEATREKYRAELMQLIDSEGVNSSRMRILEALLRLRQIANHPRLYEDDHKGGSGKFDLLIDTLETLMSENHKALVFSQFVSMLTLIRTALDERGIRYAYLDGQTTNRQVRVDEFQNDPTLPFFLISLKAGGVGLNLTAADYVIHVDPWWNPAVERQATDRTHRIGQTRPVLVTKLITVDTVEEKILELQDRKRQLADQLVSTESGFFKSLTADDVKSLLG